MNTLRLMGKLASLAAMLATVGACGSGNTQPSVEECMDACGDGCPGPGHLVCASDGQEYCSECAIGCYGLTVADQSTCGGQEDQSVQQCLDECGVGCPAPEYLICASDGQKYCNTCVIECYGLTVVDQSTCQ